MEGKNSLWDLFQKRNLSRRTFLKTCVTLTGVLGLAPSMLADVVEAAETKSLVPVLWIHGHECTGCDEAILRSQTPLASDLVLNMISLEYNDVLAASAGEQLEAHAKKIMQEYAGKYLLVVEGGIPLADDGISCMVGGRPFKDNLKEMAKNAAAVVALGTCAAYGGIQAAKPNPTKSVSVDDIISGKPIVSIPGCPPIPEVITGVLMHFVLFGQLPPLDSEGRPKQFFGNRIHDTCYRRPFFDSGLFVEKFDDAGSKAGWCLYKVGCRGPEAYNSCGNMRWYNGLSYPIQSGAPCAGCASKNFWDNDPFYTRLPNIPLPGTIAHADTIGAVAAGAAVVGVVAHGALSVVQRNKAEKQHEQD